MTTLPSISYFKTKDAALAFYIGQGLAIDDAVQRCGYSILPLRRLMNPELQNTIVKQTKGMAKINLARCRAILMEFVENVNLPVSQRIDAAKTLQAMFGKEYDEDNGRNGGNPSEMTGDQLRDAIEKLQGEMGKRAQGAEIIEGVIVENADPELASSGEIVAQDIENIESILS